MISNSYDVLKRNKDSIESCTYFMLEYNMNKDESRSTIL